MKLGPIKDLDLNSHGEIGPGHPCWAIAFDFDQTQRWEPLCELHECDETAAKAIAITMATVLSQARVMVGRVEKCRHRESTKVAVLNPSILVARTNPEKT